MIRSRSLRVLVALVFMATAGLSAGHGGGHVQGPGGWITICDETGTSLVFITGEDAEVLIQAGIAEPGKGPPPGENHSAPCPLCVLAVAFALARPVEAMTLEPPLESSEALGLGSGLSQILWSHADFLRPAVRGPPALS
ncbi:MAG: hypothetical protein AAFY02_05740 [Pseudomonadota bacterium]